MIDSILNTQSFTPLFLFLLHHLFPVRAELFLHFLLVLLAHVSEDLLKVVDVLFAEGGAVLGGEVDLHDLALLPREVLPQLVRVLYLLHVVLHHGLYLAHPLLELGLQAGVVLGVEDVLAQVLLVDSSEGGEVEDGQLDTIV